MLMNFQKQKLMLCTQDKRQLFTKDGSLVGHIGALHPELERKLGLKRSHLSF